MVGMGENPVSEQELGRDVIELDWDPDKRGFQVSLPRSLAVVESSQLSGKMIFDDGSESEFLLPEFAGTAKK